MLKTLAGILDGAILRCEKCGIERRPLISQMEYYIYHGWPRCCGEEMRLVTKREQEANDAEHI